MVSFDIASYLFGLVTSWVILLVGLWISSNFRPPHDP